MLVCVLIANTLVAAFLIGTGTSAQAPGVMTGKEDPEDPSREGLRLLGRELAERAEMLARREAEVEELLRREEMRLMAETQGAEPGTEPSTPSAEPVPAGVEPAAEPDPRDHAAHEAFLRLSKAYENMEPDSAALALYELAAIDQEAVVQLLTGWPPRTSGAILDSLTQSNPEVAARLSYEIWKRSGKNPSGAASSDR
jgi:flagellar motility protein MotE (MotC chaperone)